MDLHYDNNGKLILRCSTCKSNTFESRIEINGEGEPISNTLICTGCSFEYGEGWISDLIEHLLIEEGEFYIIRNMLKELFLGNTVSYSDFKEFYNRYTRAKQKEIGQTSLKEWF